MKSPAELYNFLASVDGRFHGLLCTTGSKHKSAAIFFSTDRIRFSFHPKVERWKRSDRLWILGRTWFAASLNADDSMAGLFCLLLLTQFTTKMSHKTMRSKLCKGRNLGPIPLWADLVQPKIVIVSRMRWMHKWQWSVFSTNLTHKFSFPQWVHSEFRHSQCYCYVCTLLPSSFLGFEDTDCYQEGRGESESWREFSKQHLYSTHL